MGHDRHRWIVDFLGDIVKYCEAHELDDVARHLSRATDKIAPIINGGALGTGPGSEAEAEPRADGGVVVPFARGARRDPCRDRRRDRTR